MHLDDALFNNLNDYTGWDYTKVGNIRLHLLYAYFDKDGVMRRGQ